MDTSGNSREAPTPQRPIRASALAFGASVITSSRTRASESAQPTVGRSDDLNVAFIGMGEQGAQLLESARPIPGLRFRAVCDIWEYNRNRRAGELKEYGHAVKTYEDYREMLDSEDLDAVLVASPDWMHAEHANACMRAGLHVYCEKEMSNSLEKARTMVETARETGMKLQIGHQRRSNPRYIHAIDRLVREQKLLGRVTAAYAQWNRAHSADKTIPKKIAIPQSVMEHYGYGNLHEFCNWRWFKKYGGGPIVDLGSHQIDIFSWVFGTNPRAVTASGGVDFYDAHEWYDTVMCFFEYENEFGISRAVYQVLTTSSSGGFHEKFMGVEGTLEISEMPARGDFMIREATAENAALWDRLAHRGMLKLMDTRISALTTTLVSKDVSETRNLGRYPLPVSLYQQAHTPHLENFIGAIRHGSELKCPAELGYETAVAVLKVNEAVEAQRRLTFRPEEFHA